jgi:redox-sensitive bicupin YhaK (pirin superfamily)
MTVFAESDCHLVIIGGAPLDGPRRINWNFVASDPLKIERHDSVGPGIGRRCPGNRKD